MTKSTRICFFPNTTTHFYKTLQEGGGRWGWDTAEEPLALSSVTSCLRLWLVSKIHSSVSSTWLRLGRLSTKWGLRVASIWVCSIWVTVVAPCGVGFSLIAWGKGLVWPLFVPQKRKVSSCSLDGRKRNVEDKTQRSYQTVMVTVHSPFPSHKLTKCGTSQDNACRCYAIIMKKSYVTVTKYNND